MLRSILLLRCELADSNGPLRKARSSEDHHLHPEDDEEGFGR